MKNQAVFQVPRFLVIVAGFVAPTVLFGQHTEHTEHAAHTVPTTSTVEPQPLLAQALRLQEALSFLGSALSADDTKRLKALQDKALTQETVTQIQAILDPYCLAAVSINPEARVKVARGSAKPVLIQGGWTSFLVKVQNDAGVTAQLNIESPNAVRPLHAPSQNPKVKDEDIISPGQAGNRFLEMQVYRNRPLTTHLSGLRLEYVVAQIYSKDAGQREAEIGFNIGQGTQDIGFRNTINLLFDVKPSVKVTFEVKDDDGSPTMASFLITDGIERLLDSTENRQNQPFHLWAAQQEFHYDDYKLPGRLRGIYPLPSRRVAAFDEYPDFFFQPQVYRTHGEHVQLPPGKYSVTFTRGPEYISQTRELVVPPNVSTFSTSFQLRRWIDLAKLGWYSADHHVHGGGCSHYDSPEEGVPPADMWRQELGEDLNVSAVLAWGPSWYHQKTFFTGKDDPLSTSKNIMRNDVEVSGFPSSHAGHIVLLRLKEDDYPGTKTIEDWPSWTLPVLTWAKSQNAVVGYAHSGWGLEPLEPTKDLPNYVIPKMDGIGAMEYIVTITHGAVDFYSLGDTPAPWELNMWYNTLNAGFRTRLSGETDFPCIYDERVGLGRSYFKPDGPLSYDNYVEAIKKGRSYVTEGGSHILDFSVNGTEPGTKNSEVQVKGKQTLKVTARVTANLPAQQNDEGKSIAKRAVDGQPYWHIERARVGSTRNVKVELLVNGEPVESTEVLADGTFKNINFSYPISKSSWLALRIYPSSHTNPVFVIVDGKPIRELRSADWCRKTVDQCWKMKEGQIRASERAAAATAYDHARSVYDKIIQEASQK
ncbi:CehA/McbA family metallohydrolase [Chryseolinea soli]|uniref:CehA/McbA family metallohydrolase n=1 Tax=Chryseolinea soli TaxID=2321403 RepID=UPI001396B2AA|nr:CehA/McbA family metallohydrolase [Chryseolinea soli]